MVRGKSEARFSVARKISEANSNKKFKKIGGKFNINGMNAPMTKSARSIGREFKDLFSDTVKDYSLDE
jgi:hypothetical protein